MIEYQLSAEGVRHVVRAKSVDEALPVLARFHRDWLRAMRKQGV